MSTFCALLLVAIAICAVAIFWMAESLSKLQLRNARVEKTAKEKETSAHKWCTKFGELREQKEELDQDLETALVELDNCQAVIRDQKATIERQRKVIDQQAKRYESIVEAVKAEVS